MLERKRHTKMKPLFRRLLGGVGIAAVLYSCASVGRIEGGPYDETPPRFISGTPAPGALHCNKNKLSIEFDEFIKLDKPNEKIVISPPQVQQPEIKSNGKKVVITLQDTLKANTTIHSILVMPSRTIMRGIPWRISSILSLRATVSTLWLWPVQY